MDWSEETLRRLWEHPPIGDFSPYNAGSEEGMEAYLHEVARELADSDLVRVDADFNPFGNQGASFIEFLCYPKDGSTMRRYGTGHIITGVLFYVSCRAPVVVYGAEIRQIHRYGGISGFLGIENVGTLPPGEWNEILQEIRGKLARRGFMIADTPFLDQLLPFEPKNFETNLGDPPYRIFDLLFYWID